MKLLGLGKVSEVKPLNPEMAIELAADMLGEVFVFSIAAGTIIFEYKRSYNKDREKEEFQNERLRSLEQDVQNLELKVEEQTAHIRELTRLVFSRVTPSKQISKTKEDTSAKDTQLLRTTKSGVVLTDVS